MAFQGPISENFGKSCPKKFWETKVRLQLNNFTVDKNYIWIFCSLGEEHTKCRKKKKVKNYRGRERVGRDKRVSSDI